MLELCCRALKTTRMEDGQYEPALGAMAEEKMRCIQYSCTADWPWIQSDALHQGSSRPQRVLSTETRTHKAALHACTFFVYTHISRGRPIMLLSLVHSDP